ncbi:MAG TPA: peptide MFS transporter [Bryobacteraceae bacterium]|jgi:POT family proton-dependent oligopeptide transporter|nr:peptide MFS transporter [Bryobacteraceae bacterium]
MAQTSTAVHADTRFFGHPRGLATLFFTEMWERYSYYGTRALLILFMTAPLASGGMGFTALKAGAVYSLYTAVGYLLALGGGWVADRITGQRMAVLYGGILISAGNFCLAARSIGVFYAGLGLLMMGTGMLKPNVSVIVGQLYAQGDRRRDSGFSLFYMGINLGAFISPIICGVVGEKIDWRLGFLVSGIGMVAGLIQYWWGWKYLGDAGLRPVGSGDPARDRALKRNLGIGAAVVVALVSALVLLNSAGSIDITPTLISDALGWALIGISAAAFYWLIFGKGWTADERKRSIAVLVLFVAEAIFWASFEQAGSSLNLFGQRNTNRVVFGYLFPASWFQSVQPLFVIALSPVFAWMWFSMGKREPSSPTKFTLALIFGGLAFAVMVPAALGTNVSPWWLVGCYLLQTLGELCLSPIGLSAMTKLAPVRAGGFVMGIWFLGTSVGNWLAGRAGGLFESMPLPQLFGTVAASALIAAVVLAILIKPTVKLMSGVK